MLSRSIRRQASSLVARRRARALAEALERRTLLAVTVTATLQDALLTDVDGDTRFDPGDTIQYTAVVSNTGDTDATGVTFSDVLDGQTNLGTVKVSPLATRDTFNAVGNTPLTMAAGAGLRANDIDIDGVTPQNSLVVTAGTFGTSQGGSVTVAADGSFTYNPQLGDQNVTDTFNYTITDGDGLSSTGRCTINLGA